MIDIIIPVYNARDYISNALNSIANQSIIEKILVTIVDDGSKEKCDDIISEYSNKLNINYIKLKKNHGAGYARQIGIKRTNNKYIFFLDADDKLIKNTALELLYNKIKENNELKIVIGKEILNSKISFYDNHILAKLIRRDVIEKYKLKIPNYKIAEDTAFIFSLYNLLSQKEKKYINTLIYEHCNINNKSLTSLYINEQYTYDDYFKAINYSYKYVKKYKNYEYFKKNILALLEFLVILYFKNFKNKTDNIKSKYLKNCYKFYKRYYKFLKVVKIKIIDYYQILYFFDIIEKKNF